MRQRWDVPDAARLAQLLDHPPAAGLRLAAPQVESFRDVYCDTPEGELRERGARYRVRLTTTGQRQPTVWLPGGARLEGEAAEVGLRGLLDPARLAPWIELDVTREIRAIQLAIVRLPLCRLTGDTIAVRRGELNARIWELAIEGPAARALQRRILRTFELRAVGDDVVQRAQAALNDAEAQRAARELRGERELALVAVEHGRLGLCRLGAELRIPVDKGSGEAACRAALRRLVGNGEGQLRLLGIVPPTGERATLEVWTVRRLHGNETLQWFSPAELLDRVGSPLLRDPATLATLTLAARSPLLPEWSGMAFGTGDGEDFAPESVARQSRVTLSEMRVPVLTPEQADPSRLQPEQFLNPELSWVEFNARVLALAEDPRTPAAARIRFLGIFSTNLDDFTATKIAALQQLAARHRSSPSGDGLRPGETLDALAIRLRPLIARQYRLFDALLRPSPHSQPELVVTYWRELSIEEQLQLRARFSEAMLPFLSPKALTRAPGHPFPVVSERRVVLLVVLRDQAGSPPHYGLVEIPELLPRFHFLPDGRRVVASEEIVRGNLDLLYPGRLIVGAHGFRITRSGDLQLDESSAANFLQAIEDELVRRTRPIVRIEIEPATPEPLRNLLQRELQLQDGDKDGAGAPEVFVTPGPLDLGALRDLPTQLPDYPPFTPREPFESNRAVAAQVDEHDVLVHHPLDSFSGSFERFITEAADDPDVQAIKLTLYRPGGGASAIGDALRRAAAAGKDVAVIVELKARFDEARNIEWAKSLERDGIHVVTGLVDLKTHAKLALVVARRGTSARRYAHVGSGNYNRDTARVYTDVGLFTADPRITADVHALFNELTGSSRAPRGGLPQLLVSPADLLERVLAMIEREAAHARAGRPARIRAKLNGLADATVTQALYRASQAGVDIDLSVRGICTLRPGVPGLSERIRVVSILGRFLEHGRIYHFANGGTEEEYYIGSADWRPRNLRRRVEVVAPVHDPALREKLDAILQEELEGSSEHKRRWMLTADGRYEADF
jgi:polyphosphate kinase